MIKFGEIQKASKDGPSLSDEEVKQYEEWEREMERCPDKASHPNVDEDGCLTCGYGSK